MRNKNYTLISVSHDPFRARDDDGDDGDGDGFPHVDVSLKVLPFGRSVASRRVEGSIIRTAYQMSRGLPRSDTVTKVVIV